MIKIFYSNWGLRRNK